jgi:sugar phosphate isomerase/epimerase
MLNSDDLIFCASNLLHAPLEDKVAAAAAGDFRGISLWPSDYHGARDSGMSDRDIRTLLDDHGLEIADLDTLVTWLPGSSPSPNLAAKDRLNFAAGMDEFFEIAEALGARSINLAQGTGPPLVFEEIVEAFISVCDRAAEHDLLALLEFMPFSDVANLETARAVIDAAKRPNAGIMFDSWHHFRSHGDEMQIRAAACSTIRGIQIGDAPRTPEPDLVRAAMTERRVPGEGDIPLRSWIRAIRDCGCVAPLGVEIFNGELAGRPPAQVGRTLGSAIRRLIALASEGDSIPDEILS